MMHVDYLSRNPLNDKSAYKECALKSLNIKKISKEETVREFQNHGPFCCEIFREPENNTNFIIINNVAITKTKPAK